MHGPLNIKNAENIRELYKQSHPQNFSASPLPLIYYQYINFSIYSYCGQVSSVGIGTELRAGRSGIEFRWGQDFAPVQTGPVAQPASCKMGTGSLPGVNCG